MAYETLGGSAGQLTVVISTVGARICQITDRLGNDWLVATGHAEPDSDLPIAFHKGSRGGWDDCFPSVQPEVDPNVDRPIGDHGDFWYRNWKIDSRSEVSLALSATGREHPLEVRKIVRLAAAETIEIDYSIANTTGQPYRFLFSGHPLFRWSEQATIRVPGGVRVQAEFGLTESAGRWPHLAGLDLSVLSPAGGPRMFKYFVEWQGQATLEFASGRSVTLRQSTEFAPWLGVCVNVATWPEESPGPDWIAIEATTSPHDSLELAIRNANHFTLAPFESVSWTTSAQFV